jgi:hypothetical protein
MPEELKAFGPKRKARNKKDAATVKRLIESVPQEIYEFLTEPARDLKRDAYEKMRDSFQTYRPAYGGDLHCLIIRQYQIDRGWIAG